MPWNRNEEAIDTMYNLSDCHGGHLPEVNLPSVTCSIAAAKRLTNTKHWLGPLTQKKNISNNMKRKIRINLLTHFQRASHFSCKFVVVLT